MASFLSRDQAFDQMVELWKASRANSSTMESKHDDDATAFSEEEDESDLTSDYSYTESEEDDDLIKPNQIQGIKW